MRLIAAVTIFAALGGGLIGCSDNDHPIEGFGKAGAGGSSGAHIGGRSGASSAGSGQTAGKGAIGDAGAGGEEAEAGNGGSSGSATGGTAGEAQAGAGVGGAAVAGGGTGGSAQAGGGAGGAAVAGGGSGGAAVAGGGSGGAAQGGGGAAQGGGGSGGAAQGGGGAAQGGGGAAQGGGGAAQGGGGAGGAAQGGGGTGGAQAGSGGAGPVSAPSAPSGVAIDLSNPFAITVSWTDTSDNESGFNLYWSADDTQPAQPNVAVAAGTQSYKLTQVFGGMTYRVWVEAQNSIGKAGTKATAGAATTDLVWNELWMDESSTIHLAMADTYGLISDADAATQLYAYHSASASTMGTAVSISPYVVWSAAGEVIDTTKVHYFWAEARKPSGSLFSLRTLAPGGAVAGLAVTPTNLDAAVSWTATAGAKNYLVYSGTTVFALASFAGSTIQTSAPVIGLNPGTTYNFWVRTAGIGIGGNGNGFPGLLAQVTSTTTGTSLGANLAANKVAKSSTEKDGNLASYVTDGKLTTRWESIFHDPEWVYVDLGAEANVAHVKLVWEAAYSKSFIVQVCPATCDDLNPTTPDGWAWQDVYTADRDLAGFPYFELINFTPAAAQFVRMKGLTRPPAGYGHSLYEVEVYGAP